MEEKWCEKTLIDISPSRRIKKLHKRMKKLKNSWEARKIIIFTTWKLTMLFKNCSSCNYAFKFILHTTPQAHPPFPVKFVHIMLLFCMHNKTHQKWILNKSEFFFFLLDSKSSCAFFCNRFKWNNRKLLQICRQTFKASVKIIYEDFFFAVYCVECT